MCLYSLQVWNKSYNIVLNNNNNNDDDDDRNYCYCIWKWSSELGKFEWEWEWEKLTYEFKDWVIFRIKTRRFPKFNAEPITMHVCNHTSLAWCPFPPLTNPNHMCKQSLFYDDLGLERFYYFLLVFLWNLSSNVGAIQMKMWDCNHIRWTHEARIRMQEAYIDLPYHSDVLGVNSNWFSSNIQKLCYSIVVSMACLLHFQ